jgi:PAS domain S-box-containing protein
MAQKNLIGTMRITIPPSGRKETATTVSPGSLPPANIPSIPVVRRAVMEEDPYQDVLRSLYDGVLITDQEGKITYANLRAIDFLRYAREELYQLFIYQVISGADKTLVETLNQSLQTQRFTYIEAYCTRNDTSIFPAEIAVNKLEDTRKGHLCFFVRDISRRKQAEEELQQRVEQTKALLSASPDLMFRLSSDGRFVDFKAATGQSDSEAPERYIGKTLEEVFPTISNLFHNHIRESCESGSPQVFEYPLEQYGKHRYFEARIVVSGENEVLCIVRDISDRKEKEHQLIEQKQEIEAKYRQLLENQVEILQNERLGALSWITGNVAHEISTPVALLTNQIASFNKHLAMLKKLLTHYEVLGEILKSGNSSKQQEILAKVDEVRQKGDLPRVWEELDIFFTESKKGITRMRDIAKNLKEFASSNSSEFKPDDINAGLEATIDLVRPGFKNRCQIREKFGALPLVRCCLPLLNQAFMALLINASQAIKDQGEIHVETESNQDGVLIRFSDTGVGIPPEEISKLFTNLVSPRFAGESSGLGLPLVYAIIRKHNGTIDAQSEVGKGTTFTIRLPL